MNLQAIIRTAGCSGCISSRLYRGVEDVRAILLEELWSSDEDVKRHLRSDKYRKVLLVMEMAAEPRTANGTD